MNKIFKLVSLSIALTLAGCGGGAVGALGSSYTDIMPPVTIVPHPPVVVVPPVVVPPVVVPPVVVPPVVVPPVVVTPPYVQKSPEGIWGAVASNGSGQSANIGVRIIVLEDGTTYGVFVGAGIADGQSYPATVVGGLQGVTTTSKTDTGATFSGFYTYNSILYPVSLVGTFDTYYNVDMTVPSGLISFSGSYISLYNQMPSLPAGKYIGYNVTGTTATDVIELDIDASGAITSYDHPDCYATGTATPRASGKNVYDTSISYTGTNCKLGVGTTVVGVMVYDPLNRQLYSIAHNSNGTDAMIFIGILQ